MSVAGLPARAVKNPWLANYLKREAKLQAVARADQALRHRPALFDALRPARRPREGRQFCIDSQLAAALKGDVNKGCSSAAPRACRSAARSGRCRN